MRAAMMYEIGKPLVIEDVTISNPGPREVLVKTEAVGVCHSDLHILDGSYPHPLPVVLGHESAGVVEKVGDNVSYVKPGDHVITCLSVFCGHCEHCITGHMSLCENPDLLRSTDQEPRLQKDAKLVNQFVNLSSYAEMMLVHEHAVVKIKNDMPFVQAALIGCGVTTGVGAVHNSARIEVGSMVAVIGLGGVGLSSVNGAAISGASRIIAIDTINSKLELAKEFGATDIINATDTDPVKAVRELTGGGVHYSFEAIGLKKTAEQAFKMVRPGGTATIIGMIPVGTMIELHGPELLREKKLQGSNMGSNRFRVDMPRYVDFYMQGRLNLDKMVSKTIKLEQINQAFEELRTGNIARSVITFD